MNLNSIKYSLFSPYFGHYLFKVLVDLSYFFCLIKKSKQKKSRQKNPASRTRPTLPGFLSGLRALLVG